MSPGDRGRLRDGSFRVRANMICPSSLHICVYIHHSFFSLDWLERSSVLSAPVVGQCAPFRSLYRSMFRVAGHATELHMVCGLMLLASCALGFGVLTQTERIVSVVMTVVACVLFAVVMRQHARIASLQACLEDEQASRDRLRGHILWLRGEQDESPVVRRAEQLGYHLRW